MIKKYSNWWINTKYVSKLLGNAIQYQYYLFVIKKKKLNNQFYNAIGVKNQEFGLDEKLKKADLRKVNNLI